VASTPGIAKYPHVFSPITIGQIELRNRIYMGPHGNPVTAPMPGREAHSVPSLELAYYFAERAAGGVGLIFHSTQVAPFARDSAHSATPGLREAIPSYQRVAELVHEHGAKIMAEVWYVPWQPHYWEPLGPLAPGLSPSATGHFADAFVNYEMNTAAIALVREAHRDVVRNLREAGYDGVELHVSHGAYFEYFLSPYFNHRKDEYGGSASNRLRALVETLEVVVEEAGSMAVGIRLTADQMLPGGLDQSATADLLRRLAATNLLDFVDLDISVEPDQAQLMSTSFFEPKLHNAKRVAELAPHARPLVVIGAPGRVTEIAEAEQLLAEGLIDMVGIVRGLIAEPDLVQQALAGEESRSRTCIAINYCVEAVGARQFGCAINPIATKEHEWGSSHSDRADQLCRVTIVGGGPAGMEAARVAADRGHKVVLFEQRDHLGGSLALWAAIPGREHLESTVRWFERELARRSIDIRLGVGADRATVLETAPDVVIVATGSLYEPNGSSGFAPFPIPGWDADCVVAPEPALRKEIRLGGEVIILDEEGLHAGVGLAELAAADGAHVHIVTRRPAPGINVGRAVSYVTARLRQAGVQISAPAYISRIANEEVTLRDLLSGEERHVDVDAVLLVTMRRPVNSLADAFEGRAGHTYVIGDALAPRGLREATYEGHRFARTIGTPDMPANVIEELFKPQRALRPAEYA
jgi:2,4-dienoyl-CoA reductase-like NADH-dependent reductase (Old Yellow Enzyme family)